MARTPAVSGNTLTPIPFGGTPPKDLAELRDHVQRLLDGWLGKTRSERTRVAYRKDIEQFLGFLGLRATQIEQMTRITDSDVSSWCDHLLSSGGRPLADGTPTEAANATVARKLTSIRSFFSYLQSHGYRGANPAHPHFVNTPPVSTEGTTPTIAPERMVSLLGVPDTMQPEGIRDKAILAVFAYMALRVEELTTLSVKKIVVNGEHTTLHIKGKGKQDRVGVIPPVAAKAVREWLSVANIGEDRDGPLFRPTLSPRGRGLDGFKRKSLTIRAVQKLVKKYCLEVGIDEKVSVHSLRVTAATEAHKAGVPLGQIQHWLGHKDPRTTQRYIREGENLDQSPAYMIRYG
ncbi:MAG: tyrosine-type recombinase/integrase [Planctomycetota bacterium]